MTASHYIAVVRPSTINRYTTHIFVHYTSNTLDFRKLPIDECYKVVRSLNNQNFDLKQKEGELFSLATTFLCYAVNESMHIAA